MSDKDDKTRPGDEELVAFLDGQLSAGEREALRARIAADPGIKERLDHLSRGGRDFAAAFEHLFEIAPAERLAAMLKQVEADSRQRVVGGRQSGFRLGLIAAGLALFIVGAAGGFLVGQNNNGEDEASLPGYWREVVAEYVALYTTDTFAGIPEDKAMQTVALAAVGKKLGLDLTPDKVAIPGLSLKGPVLFTFRGMPLAQVAYLSPDHGPIAFCVIVNGQPDQPMTYETREGRNIVYWAKGGRGYLVIGSAPRQDLEAYAATLNGNVS